MPVKAPKGKCCSSKVAKLKKANFDKAVRKAKAPPGEWGTKPSKKTPAERKASAKKASAKKAKGCRVCAKK